jgi:hypothetical protein
MNRTPRLLAIMMVIGAVAIFADFSYADRVASPVAVSQEARAFYSGFLCACLLLGGIAGIARRGGKTGSDQPEAIPRFGTSMGRSPMNLLFGRTWLRLWMPFLPDLRRLRTWPERRDALYYVRRCTFDSGKFCVFACSLIIAGVIIDRFVNITRVLWDWGVPQPQLTWCLIILIGVLALPFLYCLVVGEQQRFLRKYLRARGYAVCLSRPLKIA